jgi:hypothetical protein
MVAVVARDNDQRKKRGWRFRGPETPIASFYLTLLSSTGLPWQRFPEECGFQVIYFNSNIFFVALRKLASANRTKRSVNGRS